MFIVDFRHELVHENLCLIIINFLSVFDLFIRALRSVMVCQIISD